MIGIVYGYYVKHGGIGRYISNYLEHIEEQPNTLELIVLEKTLPVPEGISFNIINCDRNRDFLSSDENLSFSQGVNEETDKYGLIHSHGIYQISPDIYTAHKTAIGKRPFQSSPQKAP